MVSSTGWPSSEALKRGLISGLNLSGINVEDIELATVPLTRFQVRNGASQGGITVRLATGDPDTVEMRFFDSDGRDIDPSIQRKIERLLYREDFRRAFGGDIGDIAFPPRSLEFYTAAEIPAGTYTWTETKPPKGYVIFGPASRPVTTATTPATCTSGAGGSGPTIFDNFPK